MREAGSPDSRSGTLSLQGITRRFGAHAAVDSVSLDIARGELLALVGPSGSGKTTTLRIVAGYETPDSGCVLLTDPDGTPHDITGVPPQRRDFGMVFQHYALFPHMTVGENVAFGLQARRVSKSDRTARAERALANVGLEGAAGRAVQSLSGGEQQRVALARALVIEPRVLLLDEPLSNLDPTLRRATREELRATLRRLGVTALFVTHDQEDAFAVADRVALLGRGRLLQVGTPEELYDRPATRQVAEFIGRATLLAATRDSGQGTGDAGAGLRGVGEAAAAPMAMVRISIGGVERLVAATGSALDREREVLAVLRPDALAFAPSDASDAWPGIVVSRRFAGALLAYRVRLSDGVDVELYSAERRVEDGDRTGVRIVREPVAVVAR